MIPLWEMTRADIEAEVTSTTRAYGVLYATAAERTIPVPSTVYGLNNRPCTVTEVRGRRFVWVTCDEHDNPHLIDSRAFKSADGEYLADIVEAAVKPGEGR
jgi:hypothetical protein